MGQCGLNYLVGDRDVKVTCELDNKVLFSIKCGEFLEQVQKFNFPRMSVHYVGSQMLTQNVSMLFSIIPLIFNRYVSFVYNRCHISLTIDRFAKYNTSLFISLSVSRHDGRKYPNVNQIRRSYKQELQQNKISL